MHKESRIWLLELKVRKNLALTTNTLILPILGTSAQKEVPSDLTCKPSLTPVKTNPCSSPLRELCNVQLFRELLGSSPNFSCWNFPVLTTGFVCFRRVPPPPSTFIHQENSSQQLLLSKKEVSASSWGCKTWIFVLWIWLQEKHLSSQERGTWPACPGKPHQCHFKQILTRTCRVHLQTNYSQKLRSEIFQSETFEKCIDMRKMQVFPGLLRNSLWPPKRQDFPPCPGCRGRKTEQQRTTSL